MQGRKDFLYVPFVASLMHQTDREFDYLTHLAWLGTVSVLHAT
jgi:hypothetical protein